MELSKGKGREEGRGGERVKKKMRRDERMNSIEGNDMYFTSAIVILVIDVLQELPSPATTIVGEFLEARYCTLVLTSREPFMAIGTFLAGLANLCLAATSNKSYEFMKTASRIGRLSREAETAVYAL